jgi:outer membrane protein W
VAGQEADTLRTGPDSPYRIVAPAAGDGFSGCFIFDPGSSVLSSTVGNNAAELERLDAFIRRTLSHSSSPSSSPSSSHPVLISGVRISGYSSIEGSEARNNALVRGRVKQVIAYLCTHYPELCSYPYSRNWVGEDWEGFSKQVMVSPLDKRNEIQDIILQVPVYDTREALLKNLNRGRDWAYIEREMFPWLRRVEVRITASPSESTTSPQPSLKERELGHAASDSLSFGEGRSEAVGFVGSVGKAIGSGSEPVGLGFGGEASYRFALKTNLLLLAGIQSDFKYTAPVANLALEYYLTDCWSVELGAMYSSWHYNSGRKFQALTGYRLEPRYRFVLPNDRFEVYLGLYGRVGDYDRRIDIGVQPDPQSILSSQLSYTGDYLDTGLSAGMTFRLTDRWGLEVGGRAGYVSTKATCYTREDGHNWFDDEKKYNKLRMTDLNLSLTYRFMTPKR